VGGAQRVRAAVPILILAVIAGCGGAPSSHSTPTAAPATAEQVRALVRPFAPPSAPTRAGAGVLARPEPRMHAVVQFVGPDGRLHIGCADSEDAAEALVTEMRRQQ
jgi:hypothetical protein